MNTKSDTTRFGIESKPMEFISATPRTDAAVEQVAGGDNWTVVADCSRDLERELASAHERIKRLEEAVAPLAQMTDIANDADCTVWKRSVSAQSVRFARYVMLEAKETKP